jgi:predicted MPP superfamily phosphohydrolase
MESLSFSLYRAGSLALLLAIQYYLYRKVTLRLRMNEHPGWRLVGAQATFVWFGLALAVVTFVRLPLSDAPRWLMLFGVYPMYAWHSSLAIVFLVLMVGKLLKFPFLSFRWMARRWRSATSEITRSSNASFSSGRRIFLQRGTVALAGTIMAGTAYGMCRRHPAQISNITVPISNLPEAFNGFSIALISDIHSSPFMLKDQMLEYARGVNALHADMIAVTGDFVNSSLDEVYPFAEAFSELRATGGIYGVLGNHDFYTRRVEQVARVVNDCGIQLLRNDRVRLDRNGAVLHILGVDDVGHPARARELLDGVVAGLPSNAATVLLCHRPYFFEDAAARNISLTLSGHTHGGQIVLGRLGDRYFAPARMASPYVAGHYSIGSSNMYVSRGVGTVGVPVRINCPPEITKITLVREAA